ncbi:MAG: hypothetical protein A2W52_02120 [Candidatus Taylorbacteria bacterium RIFCSPHIGHO2_02_49_25]|uniref:Uncharacterized protein n=1 Tax=Candidatus Taylorbacteria bacterium RIFCSPHIGHO2_02_49_25 TaxID=1802305 RepID=A0A1G2MCZ7_9BACT|nr:MAG: hypothetical protein A2W52_02120 [Candidatus Taylorbacteria bacterium RIFCSPHIGHO2_02_49_25]OHA45857.1 MAG: hypothetical protein A3G61_03610 [Candidatus Taylorbacteria bacterium RIFCSPLOWO2_12_FULL_49_67]
MWVKRTCISPPLQKNPSSKKFSDLYFLNLSIHAREARGLPISPYAALRAARSESGERDLSLILESLLYSVRTYFSTNPD